ncbi:MAG: hypothetical protein HY958_05555 [Bacteroidia bacterium]|nr:hypothetical protein [Bacteroidia bacterium]
MKNSFFATVLLGLTFLSVSAQVKFIPDFSQPSVKQNNLFFEDTANKQKKTVFRLNLVAPGLAVEREVIKNNTILLDIYFGILPIRDSLHNEMKYYFYPVAKGEYRHYYNFERRIKEKKDISKFSGNYIGFTYQHFFGDELHFTYDVAGIIWGVQRNFLKYMYFGLNLGLGVYYSNDSRLLYHFEYSVVGDIKVGFAF